MKSRSFLSLALVAIAVFFGGCSTVDRKTEMSQKGADASEKTSVTCTGWGCSNTSGSHRRAPAFVLSGQYPGGYYAGRGYGYGQQVGDTPRDLLVQGFTYTPPNGYVQGLRKQWSYAQRVPNSSNGGFVLICWPKQRPIGTNDNLADGTPICKDGL